MRETTAYFDREKARAQIARAIGAWTGSRDWQRKDNPMKAKSTQVFNRPVHRCRMDAARRMRQD
jgi:predicted phosphohydrolase